MNLRYLLLIVPALGCGSAVELAAPPPQAQPQPEPVVVVTASAVLLQAPAEGEPFRFPADKAGDLVGQLLRPGERIPGALTDVPSIRKEWTAARGLEYPQAPLTAGPSELPHRRFAPAGPPLQPHAPREGTPLTDSRNEPVAPTRAALPTGAPVALPSVDVNQPTPLPALNPLVADRVPFDDPTQGASKATALAAAPPLRYHPVPFTPENLPDPFANAQAVRLRQPPAESSQPRP